MIIGPVGLVPVNLLEKGYQIGNKKVVGSCPVLADSRIVQNVTSAIVPKTAKCDTLLHQAFL